MRIAAPLNADPNPVLQWVEVSSTRQLPSFHIIGLPSPEVAEARERVRAAIEASGFEFPRSRIVLNLSPASVRKRGTGLDLAIALAILVSASGTEFGTPSESVVAWGELGLDGSVKSVSQLTRAIYSTWKSGIRRLIVSRDEHAEAVERRRWIQASGEVSGPAPLLISASSLSEAWKQLSKPEPSENPEEPEPLLLSLSEGKTPRLIPLPRSVERTVSVAAAGQHHLLLLGPKGAGKSQALEWRSALEPPQAPAQRIRHQLLLELGNSGDDTEGSTSIRRVSSHVKPAGLIGHAVNHVFRPGEFTLADGGLLLADELPEWARDSREALREPLERGRISINRAALSLELPASFTLAASGNLCPCGGWPREKPIPGQFLRDPKEKTRIDRCVCRPGALAAYFSRLSGPILDRIDIVALALPSPPGLAESASVERARKKVQSVRERLARLWGATPGKMAPAEIETLIEDHPTWKEALRLVPTQSLRERHKIARLALTLAAWDGRDEPGEGSFLEADKYRPHAMNLGAEKPLSGD